MERVHEYGESCQMYPCNSCGFKMVDLRKLNKHIEEEHREILYGKMKKQNLININFEDDSDEDIEWNPDTEEHEDQLYDLNPKKRNYNKNSAKNLKISKSNTIRCQKCNKTCSRKDSLRRHINKICK